jgi:hypothetical protein
VRTSTLSSKDWDDFGEWQAPERSLELAVGPTWLATDSTWNSEKRFKTVSISD